MRADRPPGASCRFGATRRVTVVARDATTADALSTALLIGGPALAEQYLATHDETLVIVADARRGRPVIMGRFSGVVVEGV